jgi:hypothetical protein
MTDNKKRVIKLKQIDLRYEKDTINKILFYYINHIDFTPNYNDTQEFINEVCVVANKMSGCFGADYINHKVYAYLFEYAIKNNEPLPNGVFADCDDIMSYNYEDNEDIVVINVKLVKEFVVLMVVVMKIVKIMTQVVYMKKQKEII